MHTDVYGKLEQEDLKEKLLAAIVLHVCGIIGEGSAEQMLNRKLSLHLCVDSDWGM